MTIEAGQLGKSWLRRRRFGVGVTLVVLVALLVRLRGFGDGGLAHFDEGAYACGGLAFALYSFDEAVGQGGLSPIIAPPLTFVSVGVAFRLLGIADWAAALVPLVAGVVTVGLTAWLGRKWFGSDWVGWLAAGMLAVCPYHVIYSRLVLADGLFLMWFVAALLAFTKAHVSGRWVWYLCAGLLTGLCWNTKYHGLLPAVVYALFLGWEQLAGSRAVPRFAAAWCRLGAAILVAAAMVVPHVLFISGDLGLGDFFGHRREFLSGDWLGNAAFAGECLVRLVKSGCVFGGAIAWAIVMWWRRETWDRFLLILLVVWVVASPWYRPYPRLYLPLAFVLIVVAARAIGLVVDQARGRARWVVFLVLGVCMVRPCWQVATMRVDGAGYRSAVDAMRSAGLLRRPVVLACQDTMRFYVLSQPGASRQVAPIWAPGFDYDDEAWRGRVACVVDGAYEDDAELQAWLASRRAQARARVPNPLGWVVTANYRSSLNADGVIRVFDVPPAN